MKGKLPFLLLLLILGCYGLAEAQVFTISSGTNLIIQSGTTFSADNMTLVPSADYTISNVSLSRNATVANPTNNTYISRVYKFSATTAAYSGTIQINYLVGELNSLAEANLQVNIDNGSGWKPVASTTNNVVTHYVVSNAIAGKALNEVTVGYALMSLPLTWNAFTATAGDNNVLLQWSTVTEQNTRNFVIQHSPDGSNWGNIGTVTAAGNSNTITSYSYVHTSPVKGINYYRVIQTDMDGIFTYSSVRAVNFANAAVSFTIIANPVINNLLQVNMSKAAVLSLYSSDGRLLLKKQFNAGLQAINMSRYAKGIYFLKSNETTGNILVQ